MPSLASRLYANGPLLMSLCAMFWATNFVVGRAVAGDIPPMTLAFLRWAGAAVILYALAARAALAEDWPKLRADAWLIVFFGVTGAGLFNTFQYIALNYTTALSAAVINSSGPILISIAAFLLFGDRLGPRLAGGILLSLLGVLLITTRGDFAMLAGIGSNVGELLMLAAMILIAIYTACLRLRPKLDTLSFAFAIAAVAALINLPLFLYEFANGDRMIVNTATVSAVAYVTLFPSVLSYLFYNRSVELLGPTRTGAFMHLVPLFAAVLGFAALGEAPQLYHLAGFALIIAGVTAAAR